MASVRLDGVSKKYGKVEAVKALTFDCQDGEFVAILGPSGAGKTSTLRMVAGLTSVDGGQIWIGDRPVNRVPPYERDIAMAFERYVLYPFYTVYENIAFPLQVPLRKGELTDQQQRERVTEMARFLEIDALLDRRVTELSGGQRQRVSLARALVRRPAIYLLDEPLSHLDAKLRNRLRGELKRIFKDLKRTVLYVTHDFREAMSMADKLLILDNGVCRQFGTPEEIYSSPADMMVADMVGDPPIDFIDCTPVYKDGRYTLHAESFSYELSSALSAKLKALLQLPKELTLGLRPIYTHLSKGSAGEGSGVQGEVYVLESAGFKQILFVTVGKSKLKVVVDANFRAAIGQKVSLEFDEARLHLFDRNTRQKIA